MADEPVVIERIINAPVSKVWKALTDVSDMAQWYFKLDDFKAEEGFSFQFYGGTEEKQYLHLCTVKEVVPGKRLSYSWRYDNYPGDSLVTVELFDEGNKTRLRLTHSGIHSFPSAADANFGKDSFTAGWTYIIGTSLQGYLEKEDKD